MLIAFDPLRRVILLGADMSRKDLIETLKFVLFVFTGAATTCAALQLLRPFFHA